MQASRFALLRWLAASGALVAFAFGSILLWLVLLQQWALLATQATPHFGR